MSAERPPLPDSYEGILQRARQARETGEVRETLALYERLIDRLGRLSERILARRPELRDMLFEARTELAELLPAVGRFAEAIEIKRTLLETHPEEADAWRRDIAFLQIAQGQVERGLAALRTLAEEKPDDIQRWIALGTEARIEGRFTESQTALDRALEVGSDDQKLLAFAHYQRFELFKKMGQVNEALAAWEQSVALDPEAEQSVREIYAMLTEVGRYNEALRYVARDENELQAGFQRGLIAWLTGKPIQARDEWQAVAELDPREFDYGYESWAEAVLRLGDPEPALEELQQLLTYYPESRLFVLAGIGWAMREDLRLATALFQQAINLRRFERPPQHKLDSRDWHLLDSLIADEQAKAELRPYFAVIETPWDRQAPGRRPGESPIISPFRT